MLRFPAQFVAATALLLASTAFAQAPANPTTLVTPPTPLLADHFGPWQSAPDNATSPATNAIVLPDAVSAELMVKRTDAKRYTAEGNTAAISAVELADATGAYSAFTLLRTPEMRPCGDANKLGVDCAVSAGKLLFWQGDTVVQIAPAGSKPIGASSFNDLVGTLPKPFGAKAAHPLLPGKLPTEGLLKETLRYAVGQTTYAASAGAIPASVLDFSKSPEILSANYRSSRSGTGLLTLVFYPTPTIAGDRLRAIQKAIADKALPTSFLQGEPQVTRSGPIVAIASNGFTAKQGAKLVEGVKYQASIAWNKPEGYMEQFKVANAASIMVQIMIFVFVIAGAALALGIVFGGGRAAFRVSRGKNPSSLADMEVISLGLRGRPEKKLQ